MVPESRGRSLVRMDFHGGRELGPAGLELQREIDRWRTVSAGPVLGEKTEPEVPVPNPRDGTVVEDLQGDVGQAA